MKIYLMRHGSSPSAHDAGVKTDFDRPLADQGREEAKKAAAYLQGKGAAPAIILASPLARAQQTAQEVGTVLNVEPKTYDPLANQVDGMTLIRKLTEDYGELAEVLLIGHQPQVGEAATYLTDGYFEVRPAGVIGLETDGRGKANVLFSANSEEYA